MHSFPFLLLFLMLATLLVLVSGLVLMARGGKLNEKYGNKLMVARVVLQALAIALLGLLFLTNH